MSFCPQIKIDDIFDAVGACAVCNVDESEENYSRGCQILEILKCVEIDRLSKVKPAILAATGTLIENSTTTLAVLEVGLNDAEKLQMLAIENMQTTLSGDKVRMVSISVYLPILCISLRDDQISNSVITLSSEEHYVIQYSYY